MPENGVDYWNLYTENHDWAKRLELNAYRVGIEWSRSFPKSTASVDVRVDVASAGNFSRIDIDDKALKELGKLANKDALNHYRTMIEDLREKGFKVFQSLVFRLECAVSKLLRKRLKTWLLPMLVLTMS